MSTSEVTAALRARLARAFDDIEIPRLAAGLTAHFGLQIDDVRLSFAVDAGSVGWLDGASPADITVRAEASAWQLVLDRPPPPAFHSFTALERANPRFEVLGDALTIARSRPLLERLVERIVDAPLLTGAPIARDMSLVTGSYHDVVVDGETHCLHVERSGQGVPVLLLHTAGADARQFLSQLSDPGLADRWSMWAVDMPFHGRSMPPRSWDGGPYRLTAARYLAWCVAILEQVIGEPAIVVGGSMGAAMALTLAAERPDLLLAAIAVEPPFRSRGRRDATQHHVGVHGALHNASFVRGLMAPGSPEADRRRAAWIYSQGAPQVYPGDLAFYSDEFDGAVTGPRIDCARTPVTLLCGSYDYSATPDDGHRLAQTMPGARLRVMDGLGHFPMCENPDLFRPFLLDALMDAQP